MRIRGTVRLLGAVSGVGFVAGGLWVAATYESLREGPLPIVLVVNILLLAACLWTMRRLGLGVPAVLSRVGSALALGGLFIVVFFLVSLLLLEGLTDRLPGWLADLGTFVGSTGSLLILPLGLMLVAVAVLRDGRLPGWARALPLLATLLLMAVPIAVAIVPEGKPEGQVAAILLAAAGATWSSFVFGMADHPSRASPGQ